VCHRAVAPDNVVVTGPGEPVLLDFGAARRLDRRTLGGRSRSVGQPSYAAIERTPNAKHLSAGTYGPICTAWPLLVT